VAGLRSAAPGVRALRPAILLGGLRLGLALGALALAVPVWPAAFPNGLSSRIRAEIARLERVVRAKSGKDADWREDKPDLLQALAGARAALAAGRPYLGLERLEEARSALRALEVRKTPSAFDPAWKKASPELTVSTQEARKRSWNDTPAAVRALAETAEGQTLTLLEASRSYAAVTSDKAGLYYLGQARATAETVRFCATLRFPGPPAPLPLRPLRSVAPELARLQERALAAFKPPLSIDRHADFIRLNATLKRAGELDAAQLYAGAVYQYLEALRQLGRLAAPDADPRPTQGAELAVAVDGLRARLAGSGQDGSLAELFLERAEELLAGRKDFSPSPADLRDAAVLVEQVLPAYFAYLGPAAPAPAPEARAVTVTLVRWPYT
jgi:hypothetical protein